MHPLDILKNPIILIGGGNIKISLAQMNSIFENKEANKQKAFDFLKLGKAKKVDFLIFPEMTLTGFSMNFQKIGETDNETLTWFSEKAKEFNLYIGFGHVEKLNSAGRNLFSVVSPEGVEVSRYSKIHPFSYGNEDKYYEGGKEISILKINEFTISTFICYDLRFPEIFQAASRKADLIAVIANWPQKRRDHWITLLKARAIENQCYIAGINRIGTADGIDYSGDSMIFDPWGNSVELSTLPVINDECLLCADLDLQKVTNTRESFRYKADRKEELYIKYFMK